MRRSAPLASKRAACEAGSTITPSAAIFRKQVREHQSRAGFAHPLRRGADHSKKSDQKVCAFWEVAAGESLAGARKSDPRFLKPLACMRGGPPVHEIVAIAEVILIDIALAADHAIVVALAASRVSQTRRQAIVWGFGRRRAQVGVCGASERALLNHRSDAGGRSVAVVGVLENVPRAYAGLPIRMVVPICAPSGLVARRRPHAVRGRLDVARQRACDRRRRSRQFRGSCHRPDRLGIADGYRLNASRPSVGTHAVDGLVGLLIMVFVAFDMIWRGIYEIEPHLMM